MPGSKTFICLKLITSKIDYAIFCEYGCDSSAINFPRKDIGNIQANTLFEWLKNYELACTQIFCIKVLDISLLIRHLMVIWPMQLIRLIYNNAINLLIQKMALVAVSQKSWFSPALAAFPDHVHEIAAIVSCIGML